MIRKYLFTWLVIFFLGFSWGCDRNKKVDVSVDSSPVAATVGTEPITSEDLSLYVKQRLSGAPQSIDDKVLERYLQELVTARSLAQEARRQQLDKRYDIRREIEQLLAARLLEEKVINPVSQRQISDEEIATFYDEHKKEYSRPEQVRLGNIFLTAAKDGDSEARERRRSEAETILEKAINTAGKRNGFATLVRTHSDQHKLHPLGDTGFFDRQGGPLGLDQTLVDKAFSIKEKGVIHDRLVETRDGFHIVMLIGRRSPLKRNVEDVTAEIIQRIRRDEMAQRKKELITSVRHGTEVKINEKEMRALAVELQKVQKVENAGRTQLASQTNRDSSMPPILQERGKE